jgi:hypothetical protein
MDIPKREQDGKDFMCIKQKSRITQHSSTDNTEKRNFLNIVKPKFGKFVPADLNHRI